MRSKRLKIRLAKLLDACLGELVGLFESRLRQISRNRVEPLAVRKILLIKFWGMGSIILSEPALRWLEKKYRDVEIHYLTFAHNRELFDLIPCVKRVHCLPFSGPLGFVVRSALLVWKLRDASYDLVFDGEFFANFSGLLAKLTNGRQVVGFAQPGGSKKCFLDVSIPFCSELHTAEQFLRLVRRQVGPCGRADRPRLAMPDEHQIAGSGLEQAKPYVVVNINASPLAVERRWPRERFAKLARALLDSCRFDLVLVGSPPEAEYVAGLESELSNSGRVRNLAGKLSLLELARVIRGAVLMISNDSGPLHMAAALDVPVVGLYGPETPVRYGPLVSPKLVFYQDLWCSPCMSLNNAKTVNCINNLACMKEIQTDTVISGVLDFIRTEIEGQRSARHMEIGNRRKKQEILLLNPPGKQVYLRDYFCSKVSQADYVNHPIDFVFLSGFLKKSFDLHLIDAIVENLNEEQCLARVQNLNPQVVVGLIGSASYAEDVPFYEKLVRRTSTRLILIGDILIDRREERLEQLTFVEAFLHDFSGDDMVAYLRRGMGEFSGLENMTVRDNGRVFSLPIGRPRGQSFRLPVPAHELFVGKGYRYPFVRHPHFATVMTDYGCPYRCTFCVMSTLGWKFRPVENVMEELQLLALLRVRELFFLDQTFGIPRERAEELLGRMEAFPHRFGWVCFSRPDVVDDNLTASMRSAGCHTVMLGLESGNQQILDVLLKDYRKEEVQAGFDVCKRQGLRTVATVLVGVPEETEDTFAETMAFLKQVDPDFASFNVAVPRMGTAFRQKVLQLGLVGEDFEIMDQSGREIAMPTLTLSREQIAALRKQGIRDFYFRVDYLKVRLRQWISSPDPSVRDIAIQLRQGYHLLRHYLARRP